MITNAHKLTTTPPTVASRKICFVVDDDEDDRDFFCTAIQAIDPEIRCMFAKDGLDAIAQLERSETLPDHIFIDMNMPLMDGRQCLAEIKKMPRMRSVPTYIYSTSGSPKLIDEIRAMGANEFLIKPTSMGALENLLKEIVA